ncbi:Peptidase S59 domain-containing protein [Mycena indigotica]|uniref:Peptidase S59 domain-containing protein n=1 Tax=Mycena indigotica TaxID=2126181 RepID=A0A8H6SP43_9AGAR|nr:Peptidase S59 domain-containing protein [Mycena indigotica]KAF7302186.1 Peptidase S59 domain-containing protein [Mycena indigotica]
MFGSTWGNNQQSQPQQQQSSVFGQPSAFGQTGTSSTTATNNPVNQQPAFGGGSSAFGQPQQQQQQPTNSIFGGGATGGTTGAFGAFGANNNNNNNGQTNAVNPVFGGAKPATGFGAFGGGGTSAFGGGGAFGGNAATTTTGVFGQTANNTGSAFGQTNSIFGKPATTTAFGATTSNTSNGPMENVPPVTTGTSNPPFQPFSEKDTATNSTSLYQSITCMPTYRGTSFEELRYQDYAQGRKTAGASATAFGQPSAFGAQQPTNNVFGQPAQQPQTSVFGQPAAQPATGFGAFGGQQTNSVFGGGTTNNAFGQPQQQQQQTSAFGAFGQPQQQQQQPQQSSVFGGGTTGVFGNNNAAAAAPKPAFGAFGNNAFGNATATTQPTTGLFGNTNNANNGQTNSVFGGGGGAFGNNNNNNAPKTGLFGQPAAQPTQNAFGGNSLFGGGQQQQPAQQPSAFGGFGTNNQQQQTAGNSLFGGNTANPAGTTNSLFGGGGANTGSGLFGNNNQQQQTNSLFGNKPTTGLFGGTNTTNNAPTTGLFGNTTQQQQPSAFGGNSLFGAPKPAASALGQSNSMTGSGLFGGGGAFGNSTTNNAGTSNLFGGSMNLNNSQQPQQMLTTSIAQPIATDLFSMLPPGPHAVSLEQSTKKKVPFFVDVPMRAPVPRVGLSYSPASSKLRGFGSSSTMTVTSAPGNPFHQGNLAASALGQSRPGVLRVDSPDALLRSSTPTLGSGTKNSVKKLILDKKVEPGELFGKTSSPGSAGKGKITFSPALSIAAREKEAQAAAAATTRVAESPSPAARPAPATGNRFAAQANDDHGEGDENGEEGTYWLRPDLNTLRQAGYTKLSAFPDLVVGRVGYGEIRFLDPVDLTGLPKLNVLLGGVIRFEDKECSVYPDSDEIEKPPAGQGLNVRARLTLVRCWAVDKATREPIKDASHPAAIKHLRRLKNMKETTFESFDLEKGEWVFSVDHF